MSGQSIVNEYHDLYEAAYYAWNPYYPLADIDLRMYLNDQWDHGEKTKLEQEGRSRWVYNLIRKNINMIEGYQRSHRLSSIVLPQESKDQQSADDLSEILQYVMANGDAYKVLSDCFSGAIKTGWNLCSVWMDYRNDPVNGDIAFGREPYSSFITDPYLTQLDFSDCGYIIKRKYMTPEQASSLLPGFKDEIFELHHQGWSRDDKFTWMPYQTQPNGQDYIAYNEFYKQEWEEVPIVVDMETGEFTEWEGPKDALKLLLQKYPQLEMSTQSKKKVYNHIILNDHYIKTEVNQFGLDEYPFAPIVAVFEPESEFWGLKLQSVTRTIIDPQRQTNQFLSQMTDIMQSQLNSGWIADEDSVINPRSLFQSSQGKVIWRNQNAKPGAIEKIQPAQIPPSFFQMQEIYARGVTDLLGINEAAFGVSESGNESAVLMQLRQSAGINNQQYLFDNLRYSQKQVTKKVLKLIQTWTPEKVERILGRRPTEQFYSKDFIKYDISVQEGILTDTQRQMHFRQLVDLKALGAPVSGVQLAKAAPIQGGAQYLKELEAEEKAQQQQAQKSEQLQMQLLQGQMEYQKAGAIEKVAGAKERFTRSVANMGLEDERAARAIDNRASAALDRAKAMKELESLEDGKLLKYLTIVRMMEESNRSQEEQVKEDDVAISARGQQRAAGGDTPEFLESIMAQGNMNVQQEEFNGQIPPV